MPQTIVAVNPDVVDLDGAIARANLLKAAYNLHLANTDSHLLADVTNVVTAVDATTQGTLNTLLNEIKADYNAHRVDVASHVSADSTNAVTASAATNLATSLTLLDDLVTMYNRHILDIVAHVEADRANALRNDVVIMPADTGRGYGLIQVIAGSDDVYIAYAQMAEPLGNGDGTGRKMSAGGEISEMEKLRQGAWYANCETGNTASILVLDFTN
jgi:hypothetical protein